MKPKEAKGLVALAIWSDCRRRKDAHPLPEATHGCKLCHPRTVKICKKEITAQADEWLMNVFPKQSGEHNTFKRNQKKSKDYWLVVTWDDYSQHMGK